MCLSFLFLRTKEETGISSVQYIATNSCAMLQIMNFVGTRFCRAPEILRALKDIHNNPDLFCKRALKDIYNPDLFSERADVYSYAMTCYEVLTGRIPFEDVGSTDYEPVCSGKVKLKCPLAIDPQVKALLERPTFSAISETLKRFQ